MPQNLRDMPFRSRAGRRAGKQDPAPPPPSTAASALGTLPCSDHDCDAVTGLSCVYVDRRGRSCGTAWCPVHRAVAGDTVYCRRHVRIAEALSGLNVPPPDIDNRAPSLVEWVADDIEADLVHTLTRIGGEREADLSLVPDPLRLVFIGGDRQRAWQRAWKLDRHTGIAYEVQLLVAEDADTEVVVSINHNIVARITPPWIERSRQTGELGADEDAAARRRFHDELVAAAGNALSTATPLN